MALIILIAILLMLVFLPGLWVKHVLKKYSEPANRYDGTGAQLARHLLTEHGLTSVRVEETEQGDHYDPTDKVVRLTPDKFNGRSLTAITVAAHEVGHALQDHHGYPPLKLRSKLVRIARPIERLGAGALVFAPFIAAITKAPGPTLIIFAAGFLTLATSTVVHLVTLPTEFNASFSRALPVLEQHRILKPVDRPHARRLLTAAALTYVSASLMSLLNIARWLSILRR